MKVWCYFLKSEKKAKILILEINKEALWVKNGDLAFLVKGGFKVKATF